MLLFHTTGTTKIGETRRYTITYSPSADRILPHPSELHLRIKNTASLPFRAAYLHGPYTLCVSVRRKEFEPWESDTPGTESRKQELCREADRDSGGDDDDDDDVEKGRVPVYEPHLKAGASFYAKLPVPRKLTEDAREAIRKEGGTSISPPGTLTCTSPGMRRAFEHGGQRSLDNTRSFGHDKLKRKSVTWIVEVVSQVIFSKSATVGFEILLGRDEKSLSFGSFFDSGNVSPGRPGTANSESSADGEVFSKALKVKVQGTADLWNLPPFPSWNDHNTSKETRHGEYYPDPDELDEARERRRKKRAKRTTKKVHLVILTHGLHSNTGADMLFMKEAIDEEARKAEALWRSQRLKEREAEGKPLSKEELKAEEDSREQVIVRGFHDNVCRTERGIKYLGKRLACYVLNLVHPNKCAPVKPGKLQKPRRPHHHPHLTPEARNIVQDHNEDQGNEVPPYKVTSISFVGHSLGGLVQTYAIAYIHAHAPTFFTETRPINFVALATPFLGLSNENPLYVKFALDFGLVGRTGQDLGLTWRAPSPFAAFSPANALNNKSKSSKDNSSKPLLRILPTGPAHDVLKMFRNRTVYANVVNDGIVPLRTSCLLFLDWRGLGKVEKAKRENSAVGGLVGWGWGQLTSGGGGSDTNNNSPKPVESLTFSFGGGTVAAGPVNGGFWSRRESLRGKKKGKNVEGSRQEDSRNEQSVEDPDSTPVPGIPKQPFNDDITPVPTTKLNQPEESNIILEAPLTTSREILRNSGSGQAIKPDEQLLSQGTKPSMPNPLSSLLTMFRPQAGKKKEVPKIYQRSQTLSSSSSVVSLDSENERSSISSPSASGPEPTATTTHKRATSGASHNHNDDDENPLAPPRTSILEAAGDVLNPPLPTTEFIINPSSRPRTIFHDRVYHSNDIPPIAPTVHRTTRTLSTSSSSTTTTTTQIKVEEKISRAYHNDLSWRKVLVRLEPDAHNNIIVRRMFPNAYGWPVVRHVVETHFGLSEAALIPDSEESNIDKAFPGEPENQTPPPPPPDPASDEPTAATAARTRSGTGTTSDSAVWSDKAFDQTDDDEEEDAATSATTSAHHHHHKRKQPSNKEDAINDFLGIPRSSSPSSSLASSSASSSIPPHPGAAATSEISKIAVLGLPPGHHHHYMFPSDQGHTASIGAAYTGVGLPSSNTGTSVGISGGSRGEGGGAGGGGKVSSDAMKLLERSISRNKPSPPPPLIPSAP